MAASEAGQCARGDSIGTCLREHVRRLVPAPHPRSGVDRECPECRKPLSINIGNEGQRFVWCCDKRCDPKAVRRALVDQYDVDPICLGNYGSDDWARRDEKKRSSSGERTGRVAPSTLAAERKFYVIEKLYDREFDSVALLKVCIRAVIESDGNVSPDPEHLLPRDYQELAALARRAGVERKYSYNFARRWLDKQGVRSNP